MRVYSLLVATSILIVAGVPFLAGTSEAQPPISTYSQAVLGETVGGRQVFVPDQILLPQLPIQLTIVFLNNETTAVVHTFTINDENMTEQITTNNTDAGENVSLTFTVLSMERILFNGTEFTPEQEGNSILFYCVPHREAGMVGTIALSGAVSEEDAEKGILLRAYWIGIIGIAATLGWVGISYFIIKSSSGRFMDHREHMRRGLP